jgi:endonuclease YncB( thermonuclease family)
LRVCVRHSFAIAGAVIAGAPLMLAPMAAPVHASPVFCPDAIQAYENVQAESARDGTTIRLQDGRELRLAGVTAANGLDGDESGAPEAAKRLHALVAGKSLALHGRPNLTDRYGRLVAQVAVGQAWLQADLVTEGLLRVAPETEIACASSLIGLEAKARKSEKGLWQNARFKVMQAEDIEALTAAVGRFAVVEGVVRRVGETSSRTYVDFGRRYTEDFSILIPRSARAGFAAAGIDLKALRGRRVRVRGVLFLSGGPAVEIRKPASLELLAGNGA